MMSSSKTKGRNTMKRFFRFLYDTWYGALVCWCVTGVVLLLAGAIIGAKRDLAWLVNGLFVLQAAMSVLLVSAFVAALLRRRWAWALWQCLCGLMAGLVFLVALLIVSVRAVFSEENLSQFKEEDQDWRASEISQEVPFAVEFRDSHPFLAEYDRRITFRSGKHVGIDGDSGGSGEFAIYALATNEFYLVDRVRQPDEEYRNEYRVNVMHETVEARCRGYAWVQVPDESLEVVGRSAEALCVKTSKGEMDSEKSVPVGGSLNEKRFVGRIFPSAKIELGGAEPVLTKRTVEYRWNSTRHSDRVPFSCEWGVSDEHGTRVRIGFRSGKKIGIFPGWEDGTKSIYRMPDGRFLFVMREGSSFWQKVYRIDPTNEILCCAGDGRWVEVPSDAQEINEIFTQEGKDEKPAQTVLIIETEQGSRRVYGAESQRGTFIGLEYIARITMDGQIVSSADEEFSKVFSQTKIIGAAWNWKDEVDRFGELFSRIFNGNCDALRTYMENSKDWEVTKEDVNHICAFRTFHAGDESCSVRLDVIGNKPRYRIMAKGRCRNPNAGYFAAARVLISELEHLDPSRKGAKKTRE